MGIDCSSGEWFLLESDHVIMLCCVWERRRSGAVSHTITQTFGVCLLLKSLAIEWCSQTTTSLHFAHSLDAQGELQAEVKPLAPKRK